MKREFELEVQAYLDGELSGRQARQVEASLERDAEAQGLLAELRMTKSAMAGSELDLKVPDTREFYWSQIERRIGNAPVREPRPTMGWLAAWRRVLVPVAGVALIAFLTVYTFKLNDWRTDPSRHLAVVENLSEHTGSYSFRSQAENMFVVWVYDRSDEANGDSDADEMIDQ